MKTLFGFLFLLTSFNASAGNVNDKATQECVIESLKVQYPMISRPSYSGVYLKDDANWEMIVTTTFEDGSSDNVFIVVKDADYKNAFLIVPKIKMQSLDLSGCFE